MSPSTPRTKRANGEGSYYLIKGTKKYKAAIKDATGKPRTKVFHREIDAQEWLIEQRRNRELGLATYALRPKDTVTQFLTKYLNGCQVKESTLKSYRGSVVRLHPIIGHLNASKITPRAIEDAYRELKSQGYSHGTIMLAHRVLSVAYRDAYRLNEVPVNVMERVKALHGKSVPTKDIPREDVEKIYLAASHDSFALARIDVGFTLGLRPGEVLGLKWSDIDWRSGTITIERQAQNRSGKGSSFTTVKQDEIRHLKISSDQMAILLRHRANQELEKVLWEEDLELIFPNSVGRILDAKKDRDRFAALCEAAGVKRYQVYQMRKTCFSTLAVAGIDLKTLQTYSGHKQVSTLMGSYVFSCPEAMEKVSETLDAVRPKISFRE
jgi:integrase